MGRLSARGNWLRVVVFLLLMLVVGSLAVRAQEGGRDTAGSSDLARENLSRVAASADQIGEVLRKEPGLMVELKRWVAKEATDHGQIVDDADLADQGIFNRLKIDIEFRSVATHLLQRYGYLIPKLNPNSPLAKEQEVLVQERARRLLRAEAEDTELPLEVPQTDLRDRAGSRRLSELPSDQGEVRSPWVVLTDTDSGAQAGHAP